MAQIKCPRTPRNRLIFVHTLRYVLHSFFFKDKGTSFNDIDMIRYIRLIYNGFRTESIKSQGLFTNETRVYRSCFSH